MTESEHESQSEVEVEVEHRPDVLEAELEAFEAGVLFSRAEGIVPASESNHAIAGAIRQARGATQAGESPVIVIGVSGSGQLDLPAYAEFMSGNMVDG